VAKLHGSKGVTGFVGMIGKQSKKVEGKQGIHHHPLMSKLGRNIEGGMKPGKTESK
jgi:hypothetical protein